jgi:hypothetical protein
LAARTSPPWAREASRDREAQAGVRTPARAVGAEPRREHARQLLGAEPDTIQPPDGAAAPISIDKSGAETMPTATEAPPAPAAVRRERSPQQEPRSGAAPRAQAEALNAGQVYVVLNRLAKAGLVTSERVGQTDRPDRKVYELTAAGRARVTEWLQDTSWPKPAPAEFHLKLVAAAAAGLADPVRLVDAQRHALLAGLAAAQRTALAEPDGSVAGLLLEGVVLRRRPTFAGSTPAPSIGARRRSDHEGQRVDTARRVGRRSRARDRASALPDQVGTRRRGRRKPHRPARRRSARSPTPATPARRSGVWWSGCSTKAPGAPH